MESDKELVRNIGIVISEGFNDVCRQTLWTILYASVAGYVTYRVSKKMYVNYKVRSAAEFLKRERELSESKLKDSIRSWKNSAEYKELQDKFTMEDGTLEDYITSLSFDELVGALQKGSLTAFCVLKSYQIKALEQTKEHNSIVGWIEEADQIARDLDALPASERKPFHGVPISIKECFYVKNTYSNSGMIHFFGNGEKDAKTSPTVQTFLNLGGVPFCKTNVPQAMYSMECVNPLYGVTTNAHNSQREAGGSSGGEGSLLAGGGSILGLGSDIGGSLRSPAACNGIFSMKPTIGRHLCYQDVVETAGPEPAGCQAIGGFMSPSSKALEYAWRAVWNIDESLNGARCDGSLAPVPFRQELFDRKMKVGFYMSEGILEAVPGVKRSILEAVEILKNNGYEVTAFPAPNIKEVTDLFNGLVLANIEALVDYTSWDVHSTSLRGIGYTISLLNVPTIFRKLLIDPLLGWLTGMPALGNRFTTAKELYTGLQEKEEMCRKYFQMMDDAGVEVIICPGQMFPALPVGVAGTFMPVVLPYIPFNMLNMPAGIAPVTRYSPDDAAAMKGYPTSNLTYKMIHSYCEGAEGLPLTVQVVAKPFHEEQVLQVLNLLQQESNYS